MPKFEFPHMCQDGHDKIGFSGSDEMCPVCKALAAIEKYQTALRDSLKALHSALDVACQLKKSGSI